MAKFKIQISASAEKALKKIPKKEIAKIVSSIQALALNPFPPLCRKLADEENVFRIRIGQYRIIYEIKKKQLIVQIIKIGHRKDVYR